MTTLVDKIVSHLDKKEQQKLTKWDIDTLKKFDEYNKRNHNRPTTRDCQIRILSAFVRDVGKTFRKMTKKDVEGYFDKLTVKPYTAEHRRMIVVKFFKWMHGLEKDDKPPEIVRGLKPNKDAYDKEIPPDKLWNDSEIKELIQAYTQPRDKALVAVLFESEARIGELLSMNIKHVKFEGDTCSIFLPTSKTKKRSVGLIFSVPYLQEWLNYHPKKNDKDGPLWISLSCRTYGNRLSDSGAYDTLKSGQKRTTVNKHINPHLLRHSMASYLRKRGYPDVLHRKRMGLAPGSRTIERYTHIDNEEVHNGYLKARGHEVQTQTQEEPEILNPKKCFRCGKQNPADAKFCSKCYTTLDYEEVEKEISILDMFKTNFGKMELQKLLSQLNSLKYQTDLLRKFQQCFDGNTVLETEKIRQHFKGQLTNDQVLEWLGVLVGYELLNIVADKVFLTDKGKLNELIKEHQNMLKVNS